MSGRRPPYGGRYGRGGRGYGGRQSSMQQQPVAWRRSGPYVLPGGDPTKPWEADMHQAARARLLATLSPEAQAATEPHPPFTVYIMRGIPGAGKSTRAAQIVQETQQANPHRTTAVHSTDVYFYNDRGEWCYDVNLLQENHERNRQAFLASLAAHVDTVIVDNTNIQHWQFQPYVQAAFGAGYLVRLEPVGEISQQVLPLYAQRGLHNVPMSALMNMVDKWQP